MKTHKMNANTMWQNCIRSKRDKGIDDFIACELEEGANEKAVEEEGK